MADSPLVRDPSISFGERNGNAFGPSSGAQTTEPRRRGEDNELAKKSPLRSTFEWVSLIFGALAIAFIVKTVLIQAFYIPSASMEPTLREGDHVIVNKLAYRFGSVQHGDVVVFERPPGDTNKAIKDLIKRVIAVPGDRIKCENNRMVLNGKPLDESNYVKNQPSCIQDSPELTMPENEYFVMGDNRGNSSDSRLFGSIKKSTIVGRAFVLVYPLGRIRLL